MKKQYFKCTLKSDIVVNASLATEGNMTTLDYISGSNFLGIVAGKLYGENKQTSDELFDLFHSGKVSFGDALISKKNNVSYAIPFSLFQDKLNKGLGEDKKETWVHHLLSKKNEDRPKNDKDEYIQLKQHRGGFLNTNKDYIKLVKKQFSLKSAHNRKERRSDDGRMFGFESIKKGQEFVFSVIFEGDKYVDIVSDTLIGDKRIGKSKTAQFGQVNIEKLNDIKTFENGVSKNKQLVIYAESNLCFFNELGQSTFQPCLSDLGIANGKINWNLSQIRTYSYSPWNTHRNTTNTQRDVIQKGSVIIIDLNGDKDVNIAALKTQVGEYTAEGLGRVIYNPEFLKADKDGVWSFNLKLIDKPEKDKCIEINTSLDLNKIKPSTSLGGFLLGKLKIEDAELAIGKAVINVMNAKDDTLKSDKIKPSQWGAIRTKATNANSIDELIRELFSTNTLDEINKTNSKKGRIDYKFVLKKASDDGYLTHGVADEKIWGINRGVRRESLLEVILKNKNLGTKFVARLAADMAKLNK